MKPEITQHQIEAIQRIWGDRVVNIGKVYTAGGDCRHEAQKLVDELYGYDEGSVLFKPTKAAEKQFRLTVESAVSYFVGGDDKYPEDKGFALQPWKSVRFENSGFILKKDHAVAMGNYFFTDTNGQETKVEYTFGYYHSREGILRINIHHSSLPFKHE